MYEHLETKNVIARKQHNIAAAEQAKDAGERMENRLFQYSTAVKSLGFERVRG